MTSIPIRTSLPLSILRLHLLYNSTTQYWHDHNLKCYKEKKERNNQDSVLFYTFMLTIGNFRMVCCGLVAQSCLTLWDPMDCILPGFSVHGVLQARILERVAISSSRGSFQPRERTCISCVSEFFTHSAFREALWETSSSPKIIFHIARAKHAMKGLCGTTEPV